MNTTTPKYHCPLSPDMLKAIGEPATPRQPQPDAEVGFAMKIKARHDIDEKTIKTREDVYDRLITRVKWIESFHELEDSTLVRWVNYEEMYAASCLKYLRELEDAKASVA